MKFVLATLLALALFVVSSEAFYKASYCEDKAYVGNDENKTPHLHCGEDFMTLKLSNGKKIHFIDSKRNPRCKQIRILDKSKWSGASDPMAITNAVKRFLEGECSHYEECLKSPFKSDSYEMLRGLIYKKNRLDRLLEKEKAPENLDENQKQQVQELIKHDKQKLQEDIKAYLKYHGCDPSKTPHRKYYLHGDKICHNADEYDECNGLLTIIKHP